MRIRPNANRRNRLDAGSHRNGLHYAGTDIGTAHCYGHNAASRRAIANRHTNVAHCYGHSDVNTTADCYGHCCAAHPHTNLNSITYTYPGTNSNIDSHSYTYAGAGANAVPAKPHYEAEQGCLTGTQPTSAGSATPAIALDCRRR